MEEAARAARRAGSYKSDVTNARNRRSMPPMKGISEATKDYVQYAPNRREIRRSRRRWRIKRDQKGRDSIEALQNLKRAEDAFKSPPVGKGSGLPSQNPSPPPGEPPPSNPSGCPPNCPVPGKPGGGGAEPPDQMGAIVYVKRWWSGLPGSTRLWAGSNRRRDRFPREDKTNMGAGSMWLVIGAAALVALYLWYDHHRAAEQSAGSVELG